MPLTFQLKRSLEKWTSAVSDYFKILWWIRVYHLRLDLTIRSLRLAEAIGGWAVDDHERQKKKGKKKRRPALWWLVTALVNTTRWLQPKYKRCGVRLVGEEGPCQKPLITHRNIRYGRCEFHMLAEDLRKTLIRGYVEKHGHYPPQ
jgi:hypothetical protein